MKDYLEIILVVVLLVVSMFIGEIVHHPVLFWSIIISLLGFTVYIISDNT